MSIGFFLGYAMGEKAAANSALRAASIPSISGVSVDDMEDMSERIDRLVLLCAAMWSILEDGGATEEQLIARVREIDAADNVLDGQITAKPTRCRKCETLVAPGLAACQFCGEAVWVEEPVGPFDTV
jgi:RNase P subunit RPR2